MIRTRLALIVAAAWFASVVGLCIYAQSLRLTIVKMERDHATELVAAREAALAQIKLAQTQEHQALARIAAADQQLQEEIGRADKMEIDLAAAVLRGERRVRPSICAARVDVPGSATAAGRPDAAADDGARRVAAIVRSAAACDSQVKGLQQVIRAYRRD